MFEEAATDFDRELVKVSPGGLTYFAEAKYGRLEHKMDHLACFAGSFIKKVSIHSFLTSPRPILCVSWVGLKCSFLGRQVDLNIVT